MLATSARVDIDPAISASDSAQQDLLFCLGVLDLQRRGNIERARSYFEAVRRALTSQEQPDAARVPLLWAAIRGELLATAKRDGAAAAESAMTSALGARDLSCSRYRAVTLICCCSRTTAFTHRLFRFMTYSAAPISPRLTCGGPQKAGRRVTICSPIFRWSAEQCCRAKFGGASGRVFGRSRPKCGSFGIVKWGYRSKYWAVSFAARLSGPMLALWRMSIRCC